MAIAAVVDSNGGGDGPGGGVVPSGVHGWGRCSDPEIPPLSGLAAVMSSRRKMLDLCTSSDGFLLDFSVFKILVIKQALR